MTGTEDIDMVTVKDLEAFGEGWNRHDVDFLMAFMADDCVRAVRGAGAVGKALRREGCRARGLRRRVQAVPRRALRRRAAFRLGRPRALGVAVHGLTADGKKIEVTGCDVFTFKGDKIAVKNSYLKTRTA